MTNGKHRARWLAELISDAQHYLSRAREAPEAGEVRQAISHIENARQAALASDAQDDLEEGSAES